MPHEYDFFTWLRHLSEAQTRADEKALAAQKSEALIRDEVRRLGHLQMWGGAGGRQQVESEKEQFGNLRQMLKFLGED